jgi:hypothetical protein
MLCEVDVLQYYEQFLVLSELMTITGFLTSDERDTAFWCGFHLDDRRVLQPHSLDTPLHFEDVFMSARAAFAYKSEPAYMPLPIPTSPPISSPFPLSAHPHPSPERPPEVLRPASAPPILQCFNDLGEGDLCPQVDLSSLPRTCHGSRAHEMLPSSPLLHVLLLPSHSSTHLPSPPSPLSPLPSLLVPSPFPQSPARSLSLLCDSLLAPSVTLPPPIPTTSLSQPPHFDSQPLLAPAPPPLAQLPTRLLSLPCDLSPDPPSPPSLACATSFPPAPNLSLTPISWPLDSTLAAPRNVPPPLAFPPSPPPRPPDPTPADSVEPLRPPSTHSLSLAFPSQLFDCSPTPPDPPSPLSPIGASSLPPLSALDNSPTVPVCLRPEPSCLRPMPSCLHPVPSCLHPRPLRLCPVPTRPPPLPPDASLASLLSPWQLAHAAATSPPSPHFLPLASRSQLLGGSCSLPYDPSLLLVVPPPPPPRPPDPTPAHMASLQPPPPSPLVSSPTNTTNAIAMHHEVHRSKQLKGTVEPQNHPHPQHRHYHQRLC